MRPAASLVLLLLVGCEPKDDDPDRPDAAPAVMYQPFDATTWGLAIVGDRVQLSVTDGTGGTACTASQDHHTSPGPDTHQMILNITMAPGVTCPVGSFDMRTNCPTNPGSDAFVVAGCAYYREWDAQGQLRGSAASRNGIITIAGTETNCTVRANVGFLGGSFANMATLVNGVGAQPWCGM
jgi:hypothetical protein